VADYQRSWPCDCGLLENHAEPIWRKKYLDQITKADVISLIPSQRKTHAPGSCIGHQVRESVGFYQSQEAQALCFDFFTDETKPGR